jgi:hypothetical protein
MSERNAELELTRRTAAVAGMLSERYPAAQITTTNDMGGCVGFRWAEIPQRNTITVQVTHTMLLSVKELAQVVRYVMKGWPQP